MRIAHAIEFIFLSIGFLCLGWFGYSVLERKIDQSYENYKLEAERRGEKPSIGGYIREVVPGKRRQEEEKATPEPQRVPENKRERPKVVRGEVVGRIEVPRINVSAVVREGDDDKTLKRAAGHIPYTPLPGDQGNVGVAAHRDTFFRNLKGVRKGDLIRMVTTWGTYEYKVASLKIVRPENVEVLDQTAESVITLVTCYPFNYVGSAPKRFIVRAIQTSPVIEASGASAAKAGGG
jgi:sortase A